MPHFFEFSYENSLKVKYTYVNIMHIERINTGNYEMSQNTAQPSPLKIKIQNLEKAAQDNDVVLAYRLLQDKEVQSFAGQSQALRNAAEKGHVDMVKLLLKNQSVREAKSEAFQALMRATNHKHLPVVSELRQCESLQDICQLYDIKRAVIVGLLHLGAQKENRDLAFTTLALERLNKSIRGNDLKEVKTKIQQAFFDNSKDNAGRKINKIVENELKKIKGLSWQDVQTKKVTRLRNY